MSGNATRGWINSRVLSAKVSTVATNITSSTVLANVTGLSHKLLAGKTYIFDAYISGVATTNGGAQAAIAGDASLTASQFLCNGNNSNTTTANAVSTTTTLGTAVGSSKSVLTDYYITGTIVVKTSGVLSVQLAQNTSSVDTTTANVGSYLFVMPIE